MCFWIAVSYAFKIPLYEKKVLVAENEINMKHRINVADDLFSSFFFPFMAYLAIYGSIEIWEMDSIEARWHKTTVTSRWFMLLYVARMILHLPIQTLLLWKDSKVLLAQMTAHHIFSAICFGIGLVTGRMHFWGLFAGCCEVTTGFLAMLCISMNCFPPNHSAANIFTAIVGLLLWLGFVVFRIILFPVWMYLYMRDAAADPELTWAIMSPGERIMYPGVITMLFVLSSIWMWPITRGLLKVLGFGAGARTDSPTDKESQQLLSSPTSPEGKIGNGGVHERRITKSDRTNSYASPLVSQAYDHLPVIRRQSTKPADSPTIKTRSSFNATYSSMA